MTPQDQNLRLDFAAARYLEALERDDFDTMAALWGRRVRDPDLEAVLHELHAGLIEERLSKKRRSRNCDRGRRPHTPPKRGDPLTYRWPVTVADVAAALFRHPPPRLPAEAHLLNEKLLSIRDQLPEQLGLSKLIAWAEARFGKAPLDYWWHSGKRLWSWICGGRPRRVQMPHVPLHRNRRTRNDSHHGCHRDRRADLRRDCGVLVDLARRGPVLLNRFFAETTLRHVALPNLTRGAVGDRLKRPDIIIGDAQDPLAGFVFVAGRGGPGVCLCDRHTPPASIHGGTRTRPLHPAPQPHGRPVPQRYQRDDPRKRPTMTKTIAWNARPTVSPLNC